MKYPFTLPQLPYPYDALEPYIDARTMEIHHLKHHQTYIDKLNGAMEKWTEGQSLDLEEILKQLNMVPEAIRGLVRNHGGGHYNHSFFWKWITPQTGSKPSNTLTQAIESDFKSFEKFKEAFTTAAIGLFGSGWVWLVAENLKPGTRNPKLLIVTTPNQDTPLALGLRPLLGLDVWEHAYYLKYQNRRQEYIEAWWNIVNWDEISR